ncbi:MAG: CsgG/HfaB family protein [Myxococcota bacterium]|nr:CsgG/HfaB family protein [Myxococcota bacterium]
MRDEIFGKLEYDRTYFQSILALNGKGKTDGRLTAQEFAAEVKRARANLPVLERIFNERAGYKSGKALSFPGRDEVHRVYTNLITLLNMLNAFGRADYKAVLDAGERVTVADQKDFGLVRTDDPRYYLNLYREFFYLMAGANYRLGRDSQAVSWLARAETDVTLQELRKKLQIDPASGQETRAEKVAKLRLKPLAVMPFISRQPAKETDWMGPGLAEVLANDLVRHTDLLIVERSGIDKVLKEIGLSQAGLTDDKNAQQVGQLLSAGTLLVGSFRAEGGEVFLSLRLVEVQTAQSVAANDSKFKEADLVPKARAALIDLLTQVGWVSEALREEVQNARAPKTDTLKSLVEARLLLASKSDQSKALYAKAMKDDPEYAKAFDDLEAQFSNISSLVAVMPFVNVSGVEDDLWMVTGVSQALSTDLPKIGFTLVERTQLAALLNETKLGQVLDPVKMRGAAQKAAADFLVVGSVLHQDPTVRIDLRFVEVKNGLVLNAMSAEGRSQDFPELLTRLAVDIARRFNEKVSDQTLAQLAGKKMSREEFERFARQELQKERLARVVKPVTVKEGPSRAPFWIAAGTAAGGTAIAALGLGLGSRYGDDAAYSEALLRAATRPEDQARLTEEFETNIGFANTFSVVGYAGAALAVGSVGFLVYQELFQPQSVRTTLDAGAPPPAAAIFPYFGAAPGAAVFGVGGTWSNP